MSSAFVKESDDQWLSDIGPSMNALVNFLTRDNNGVRVYETGTSTRQDGKTIHQMSNGVSYTKDSGGHWEIATSI